MRTAGSGVVIGAGGHDHVVGEQRGPPQSPPIESPIVDSLSTLTPVRTGSWNARAYASR